MPLILVIQPADGEALRTRIQPGRNRVTVRVGDTYRILDEDTGRTPARLVVRQLETSLIVDGLDPAAANPPVVELAEFYTLCSAASPCQLLLESTASGGPVAITPGTAPIGALADGGYVLFDPAYLAPAAPATDGGVGLRYGLYGLGGLAVVGLAAGGGGGGGGGGGSGGGPVAGGGGPPPPDGTLKLVSGDYNVRKPTLAGEGQPGDQVTVRIDINGDGAVDVTYVTTVGDDFRWTISLASAVPTSGTLPADGLRDAATLGVSTSGPGGSSSLAPATIRFDDSPPAPARIDRVTGDDLIVGPEKAAGVVVAGSAEPGATILLDWAGRTATTTVDAAGRWSVTFPAVSVPPDGASTITATVQDSAGNRSPATTASVTVDSRPALFGLGPIAGDGILSLVDGDTFRFTGTAESGTRIAVTWNGLDRIATTGSDGQWSVAFSGAEIPLVNATQTPYTITATNLLGNVAGTNGTLLVDRVAPAAPAIDTVAADDRVSQGERAGGIAVSGTATAGEQITVTWGATNRTAATDAAGHWTTSFAAGELPVVGSPGGTTTITVLATDAAGNIGTAATRQVYIELPFAPPTIDPVAGNDVVNAAERNAGVTLAGAVTPGGPGVVVTWGAWSGAAAVSGGRWQITVPAGEVPGDGASPVVATIAGFPGVAASRPVVIDATPPPAPAIAPVTGDNVVTPGERASPVAVTGTAEAGATVVVTWGATTQSTTASAGGAWQVDFSPAQIPSTVAGVGLVAVTAVATDAAGNAGAPASQAVQIVTPFGPPSIAAIEADDIVNAAERADGVVIQGSAPAGSPGVQVDWGGFSGVAVVAGTAWSINVPAGSVPADGTAAVVATITGPAGGAASARQVTVDTTGPTGTVIRPVTGDDTIDFIENLAGFGIAGSGEAGARIDVTVGSLARTTTVDGNGNWAVGPINLLPSGTLTITALATDAAGNPGAATTRAIEVQGPPAAIGPQALDDPTLNLLA